MTVDIAEKALKNRGNSKWDIKGNHLTYTDGDTRFLFDKIKDSLLGFRKLTLVSDGRLIEMSLLEKIRLAPLVRKKKGDVIRNKENDKVRKAIRDIQNSRTMPLPPPPRPRTLQTPSMDQYMSYGQYAQATMSMPAMPDLSSLREKVNESKEEVKKTLTLGERREKKFREDVVKEKARIREILRKK